MAMRGNVYQFPPLGMHGGNVNPRNEGRAGGKGSFRGKAGRGAKGENMSPKERMRALSKGVSTELRHVFRDSMQNDVFMPIGDLIDTPTLIGLRADREDIRGIVRGEGGNDKKRFEL